MIKVEIWSDVLCPWCWIGKHRFEKALAASPHRDRFQIVHRAFRLDPGAKVTPVLEMFMRKFRVTEEQAKVRLKEFETNAKDDGLEFNLLGGTHGDSIDAHRLLLWSEPSGKQMKLVETFYEANFSKSISMFDEAKLLDLVAEAGLDRDEAQKMLATDAFKNEVVQSEAQANAYGASGVPFFVFDQKYGVSGAQAPATFTQVIEKVLADNPAPLTQMGDSGEVCGPDGCEIPKK